MNPLILPAEWWLDRRCFGYFVNVEKPLAEVLPKLLERHGKFSRVIPASSEGFRKAVRHFAARDRESRGLTVELIDTPKGEAAVVGGTRCDLVAIWTGWP